MRHFKHIAINMHVAHVMVFLHIHTHLHMGIRAVIKTQDRVIASLVSNAKAFLLVSFFVVRFVPPRETC